MRMFDAVTIQNIPLDAEAAAGYVGGRYPTFHLLQPRLPHAHLLSIAVFASQDADCLDVEAGDASPADAPGWVHRQKARGAAKPVIYCSLSVANSVLNELATAGIPRTSIRLWTAHYTHVPHRCSAKCGFNLSTVADATQWTDRALGRSLDESLCADDFFATAKPASGKRHRWRVRLARAQNSLRHLLAYRRKLRADGHDKGPVYYLSSVRLLRLKAYIRALEKLLKR